MTQAYGQPEARTASFSYYTLGRPATTTDANGHVTTYGDPNAIDSGYDPSGQPLKVTDPLGQVQSFTFWPHGQVHATTDRNGHSTTMVYTARDQLKTSTDAENRTSTYTYDLNGNQYTAQTPLGLTTTTTSDNRDLVLQSVDAAGSKQSYTYFDDGNRATAVSPRGNASGTPSQFTTSWTYSADNRLREVSAPAGAAGTFGLTDYLYFADGKVQQVTGPGTVSGGRAVSSATWTPAGSLASETQQDGPDSAHTNQIQNTTFYCYDAVGNQLYVRLPMGESSAPSCPAANDTTSQAYVTRSYFDHLNQLTSQIQFVTDNGNASLSSLTSSFKFDAVGNQVQAAQPDGNGTQITTHVQYDALNRILATDDPTNPGHSSTFKYLPGGQQSERDDTVNGTVVRTTTSTYNPDNSLQETDVTDPINHTHLYTLNYTSGQNPQTGYDADGNLLRTETWTQASTTQAVATLEMTYLSNRDLLSTYKQTITTAMPNVSSVVARTQTYAYNEDGILTSRQGCRQRQRDHHVRLLPERPTAVAQRLDPQQAGHLRVGSERRPQFGFAGERGGGDQALPPGRAPRWVDGLGSRGQHRPLYTGLGYNANDQKTSEQVAALQQGGTIKSGTASYSYDELSRLLSYTSPFASQTSQAYTLDDAGNIVNETDHVGSATTTTASAFTYNRLTTATISGANPYKSTFAFDGLGEQIARSVGSQNSETSTYDAAGHTASHATFVNSADPTNPSNSNVSYVTDAQGRILERVENPGPSQKVYLHFYNGPGSQSLAEETDQSGAVQMRYVSGPSGQAIAQFDAIATDNESGHPWTWYAYDSRGNVANRTDDNGAVVETIAYSPYGRADTGGTGFAPGQNKTTSHLGFQGAWKDPVSSQYALSPRTFDPGIGRFTSSDSYASANLDLGLQSDALTGDRYLYAGANPAGYFDDGHSPSGGCDANGNCAGDTSVEAYRAARSAFIGPCASYCVSAPPPTIRKLDPAAERLAMLRQDHCRLFGPDQRVECPDLLGDPLVWMTLPLGGEGLLADVAGRQPQRARPVRSTAYISAVSWRARVRSQQPARRSVEQVRPLRCASLGLWRGNTEAIRTLGRR